MNHPVAHVLAGLSHLFGPAFVIWVGVAYVWPDRHDTVFVLVFLAIAAVFFWLGFGWMIHHLRRARSAGRSGRALTKFRHTPPPRDQRGTAVPS